MPLKFSN